MQNINIKSLFIYSLLLSVVCYLIPLSSCISQQTNYQETFNMPNMDGDIFVIETADGGFITTGQAESIGAGSCDIYAFKKDHCGKVVWFKTYGGAGSDGGTCIKQTADGGYILSGLFEISGYYDACLLKIDAGGNVQWLKTYGGGTTDYGLYVQQTSDGGYILTGHTESFGAGAADVYVVKTDNLGNVQWEKTFGGAGSEVGNYIEQTPDGGYIISGATNSFGSGGYDIVLIKTDASGNMQWSKVYGGAADDGNWWIVRAPVTSDGGYLLSSFTASYGAGGTDIFFIKTDSSGNVQWSKTYGGPGDDQSRFSYPVSGGDFASAGYTRSFGAGGMDYYLLLTDSIGNVKWFKTYGDGGDDKAMGVQQATDGGFILCGNTNSFGADYYDIYFIKTDSAGNTGCYSNPAAPTVNNVAPNVSSIVPAVTSPGAVLSPGVSANIYNPTLNRLCIQCYFQASFTYCHNQLQVSVQDTSDCVPTNVYWDFGDGYITTAQNPSHIYAAPGTYTITFAAADSNTFCADTVVGTITIDTLPVAQFTFTNNVCLGTPMQFSDSSNANIDSWYWDFGDGNYDSIQNPSHIYLAAGTYNVMLRIVYNNGLCTDSITIPVNVSPIPVANFTASDVCLNAATTFTDLSTISSGVISTYQWDFGDFSGTSLLQNPTYTYSSSGIYSTTLIVISNYGCKDTITTTNDVFPLPVSTATNTGPYCEGATIQLNSGAGGIGYSWNGPLGYTNLTQNPTIAASTVAMSGIYTVTVTAANGCTATATTTVTVNPLLVPTATNTGPYCEGATIQLISSAGGIGYSWSGSLGYTNLTQNPTIVASTVAMSGVYTVIITAAGGCTSTATSTVTIFPLPIPNFNSTIVCPGFNTSFSDLSTLTGDTITGWSWNFGDPASGANNTSLLQNPIHLYSSAGTYSAILTLTSNNGCVNSAALPVLVYPLPNADFSFFPSPIADLLNQVVFSDLSTGGVVQWQWLFGDNNTSSAQYPSHFYTDTGTYIITLMVTSNLGCWDTIQYPIKVSYYSFYIPNAFTPNGDEMNEFFFGQGIGITEYEMWIFNRWGERIFYCNVNDLPQTEPCRWNGKAEGSDNLVQQGAYVWKVRLKNVFKKEYTFMGSITVVR